MGTLKRLGLAAATVGLLALGIKGKDGADGGVDNHVSNRVSAVAENSRGKVGNVLDCPDNVCIVDAQVDSLRLNFPQFANRVRQGLSNLQPRQAERVDQVLKVIEGNLMSGRDLNMPRLAMTREGTKFSIPFDQFHFDVLGGRNGGVNAGAMYDDARRTIMLPVDFDSTNVVYLLILCHEVGHLLSPGASPNIEGRPDGQFIVLTEEANAFADEIRVLNALTRGRLKEMATGETPFNSLDLQRLAGDSLNKFGYFDADSILALAQAYYRDSEGRDYFGNGFRKAVYERIIGATDIPVYDFLGKRLTPVLPSEF